MNASILDIPLAGKAGDERMIEALLALNNDHAIELSPLDRASFNSLIEHAFARWRIGVADALMLAFDQDAAYDGENIRWFRRRFDRFVYIDRLVISPSFRERGFAGQLYDRLFAAACASGHDRVVCEINVDPPNPASVAFHSRRGFEEIGRAEMTQPQKRIAYYVKQL